MRVRVAPGLKLRRPDTKELLTEEDGDFEVSDTDLTFAKFLEQGDVVRTDEGTKQKPDKRSEKS